VPRFLCIPFFLFLALPSFSQHVYPRIVCDMPDSVFETSGICVVSPNRLYTHNDSGDQPRFYEIDTLGTLLRTIWLGQSTAIDFEDITRDDAGNIYIGDFGNNLNLRTDLRIYKLSDPQLLSSDTTPVAVIGFNYPDQQLFPPPAADQNFDCESLIYYRDSLYLFSKNRGISEYSRIYRLPAQPGNYTATLVDSVYTGKWLTSAALNPGHDALVLLSETQLWIYRNFTGGDFSMAAGTRLEMDSTQKEGITFINDTAVYISDERFLGLGGHLYYLSLGDWLRNPGISPLSFAVQVLSNPSVGGLSLQLRGSTSYTVEIFNELGQLLASEEVLSNSNPYTYYSAVAGIVFVRVTAANGAVITEPVLIY
jgi:hypothetical protein